jgi:hypothetical protein
MKEIQHIGIQNVVIVTGRIQFNIPLSRVPWLARYDEWFIFSHLLPPTGLMSMFGNLSNGLSVRFKFQIGVGLDALYWVFYNCQSDILF